jgi:GntR family transcriptional regulator
VASERTLAKAYHVSLLTARQALKELELDGLVKRQQCVGTFVAPPKIEFNKLVSFTEQMASRGFVVRSRILAAAIVRGDYECSARLGLIVGADVLRIERVRLVNGEPSALELCYFPADTFAPILKCSLERRPLFDILERDLEIKLAYADEEVDATAPNARASKLLGTDLNSPMLRIRQVVYAANGNPVMYNLGLYRHTLHVRRYR